MSKVLFINGTAHGHLNPTFPLVQELVKRGEEVTYFSTGEFRQKIEACGALFMDYGDELAAFFKDFRPSGSHPFFTLIEFLLSQNAVMSQIILEKTKGLRFDYIIHDAMMGGGSFVARTLGIPAVCSCTSFAANKLPVPPKMLEPGFHPQLDSIYKQIEAFAVQTGYQTEIMDVFFQKENLNIVFTSRLFQADSDSFDDSYKFVGPSIDDRGETGSGFKIEPGGKPLVYISMGTINNGCAEFYQKCMEAFREEDVTVVMSIGGKVDIPSLGEIPANFTVRSYVPQLEVLKKASAFISHGGLNSVSEALYFGVPVVAIPQANDQPMVARRLVALGAGLELKMDEVTPEVLQSAVRKLLADPAYASASRMVGESFVQAGGFVAAADAIFDYKMGLG
jgi:MGT family glycosyltransferase